MSEHITILGGGNTAFAAAANLTLKGFGVTLCELPEFEEMLDPVRDSGVIHLVGVEETGAAKSAFSLTTDIETALNASDLILVIVPAYAHKPFALACAPYLGPEHTVVLMPGTLGTLEWATLLKRTRCGRCRACRGGYCALCVSENRAGYGDDLGHCDRVGVGGFAG